MPATIQRIFAHTIFYRGERFDNAIAELNLADDSFRIFPFEQELHSTRYFSGAVELRVVDRSLVAIPINA